MRRRGRQEILLTNDVVDNHAAFAAIKASATEFPSARRIYFIAMGITNWSAGPRSRTSGWLRQVRCEIIA